jgi:hypothetical protein
MQSGRRDCVICYGKKFSFPPPGVRGREQAKREAEAQAEEYGRQVQATMREQAGGRELTVAEINSGKLAEPPASTGPKLLGNPNRNAMPRNEWDSALAGIEKMRAFTPGQRAQRDRLLSVARARQLHRQGEVEAEAAKFEFQASEAVQQAKAWIKQNRESAAVDAVNGPKVAAACDTLESYLNGDDADLDQFYSLVEKLLPSAKKSEKPTGLQEADRRLASGDFEKRTSADGGQQ